MKIKETSISFEISSINQFNLKHKELIFQMHFSVLIKIYLNEFYFILYKLGFVVIKAVNSLPT